MLVTTMSGKGAKEVSCGEFSSYAVTREGEFWAWGGNTMGQLGLGHTKNVDVPQVCPWLPKEDCIRIAAGGFHTVLLCARNRVFSFGQNDKGVLGNGQRGGPECWTTPQLLEPLLGKGISDIKCGAFHGVALGLHQQTGRRRVYTWGWNSHGQLGLASLSKVSYAPPLKGITYHRWPAKSHIILVAMADFSWDDGVLSSFFCASFASTPT